MIEQTKEGWWIIQGDTHLSKWVRETGNLCHDEFACSVLHPFIKPEMICVDIGANIGTIAYFFISRGASVWAFEPQAEAYECLIKNCPTASCMLMALGEKQGHAALAIQPNRGASFLTPGNEILVDTLDDFFDSSEPVDFIKIDAEGKEKEILKGGRLTINRCKPIMLIEINKGALSRNFTCANDIFMLLSEWNYQWKIAQPDCNVESEQYDIIATQIEK